MIKVYLDVNIVMDFLLIRKPHFTPVSEIIQLAKTNKIEAIVDARSLVFTFFHMMKKDKDAGKAKKAIKLLIKYFTIISTTKDNLVDALNRELPDDLEDGVQLEMALVADVDLMITGDKNGFPSTEIKSMSATEFLQWWKLNQ